MTRQAATQTIKNQYGRGATADQIKPYFGLKESDRWPKYGMALRTVHGIRLFVRPLGKRMPADPNAYRASHKREGGHIRLMAYCPECDRVVSYGRLHQHRTIHTPQEQSRMKRNKQKSKNSRRNNTADSTGYGGRSRYAERRAQVNQPTSDASTDETELIGLIADRGVMMFKRCDMDHVNRLHIMMDIDCAHEIEPMDLEKLLEFDDFNFSHDLFGIYRHLDRKNQVMTGCFLPRCTA